MDKQYIDCQVVMLPKAESVLKIWNNTKQLSSNIPQNLHFTSDEEILEDDYYITEVDYFSTPLQIFCKSKGGLNGKNPRKIVASTDPSLDLPGIPQSFLEQYIATNGRIDIAALELERYYSHGRVRNMYRPKLTANNEVIVINESIKNKDNALENL